MSLLIDGFNLLYKLPELEEKMYLNNLIDAQKGLLDILKEYNKIKPEKIRVVFDGKKKQSDSTRTEKSGKIDVYYSQDYSADYLIKQFVKKDLNPKMVTVVTSDNDIISFVKRFHAKVVKSENFSRILLKTIDDYYTPDEPEKEDNPEMSDDEISFWEKMFTKKKGNWMYIDTHAHFDLSEKNNKVSAEILVDEMKESDLQYAVQISIDPEGFQWSYDFAKKFQSSGIRFSLGIHPSTKAMADDLNYLENFILKVISSKDDNLLFGIGECGLDYFRMHQEKEMQIESFNFQIELSKRFKLPLIVHSRDAMDDTINILKSNSPYMGIMHCFPGDKAAAKKALDLGFYISYAGNVTFNKATELHESAEYVPLDRILLETDAPFLTPVPYRGKKNRPEYVSHVYKFIAELKNIPEQKLIEEIFNNFITLRDGKES